VVAPALLPWTGDEAADRLLAQDPNALLIGFVLADNFLDILKYIISTCCPLVFMVIKAIFAISPKRLQLINQRFLNEWFGGHGLFS
jgi:hypothetical protein